MSKKRGKVSWLNALRGNGFIQTDDGDDVFFYTRNVETDETFGSVQEDDQVDVEMPTSKYQPAKKVSIWGRGKTKIG